MNEYLDLLVPQIGRMKTRAERGEQLKTWGLLPSHPEPGSSLALDDAGFSDQFSDSYMVSGAAMFPAMTATDNLVSASVLVKDGSRTRELHAPSLINLCRAAMELSTRAIWVLLDTDREVRRQRALGVLSKELDEQNTFISITENGHEDGAAKLSDKDHTDFLEHKKLFEERRNTVRSTPMVKTPAFRFQMNDVAKWLTENTPPHDSDELAGRVGFAGKRAYNIGSASVHGYRWMTDYLNGTTNLLGLVADAFAGALITTECAVALIEAQSVIPSNIGSRPARYPEYLQRTVRAWAPMYQ
ncbi:hypothetical protein ABZV91_06720 [Nocardia sp. NPDC004568]|uniref:hypothetical protein n=1 Tax=Nocardia sp. NPDC004568 TaxID=3154551 RepID=UPI0033A61871